MWIEEKQTDSGIKYLYRERYKTTQGKTKIVSVTLTSNNRMAVKRATTLLQEKIALAKEKDKEDHKIYFHKVIDMWLEHTDPTVKYATRVNHRNYARRLKKSFSNKELLIKITPSDIERVVNGMYYVEELSYSYCKGTLTIFKMIMRFAKRKHLLQDIAEFEEVTLNRKPQSQAEIKKRQNKFLDPVELKECLAKIKAINLRVGLAMEFMSRTGLRIGELLAIRTCDYDREKKEISVNGTISQYISKSGNLNFRGTPKNIYSVRTVALDERSIEILKQFMIENKRQAWAFNGYKDIGYIFTSMRGNPYNIQFIGRVLRKVHYKDKHITTHIFRHTHISILSELGLPLKAIMERVGHNDPNTTLSIYTHVTNSMREEVVSKLNSFSM